ATGGQHDVRTGFGQVLHGTAYRVGHVPVVLQDRAVDVQRRQGLRPGCEVAQRYRFEADAHRASPAAGLVPITYSPGDRPVTNSPGARPVTNAPGARPVTNAPGARMVTNSPWARMVTNSPWVWPARAPRARRGRGAAPRAPPRCRRGADGSPGWPRST